MSDQAATTITGSVIPAHQIKVLLVDDQAIIGEAVRRMLAEESDIQYRYCADPTQTIALANEWQPTVILQDLVMPQMDGLTLVKYLRANPATRETPLIVLSSKEEPRVKADAFALGANDYLVKLPDRIELLARIRYHSKGYINLLERNEAYRKLLESQSALAAELAEAAAYVESMLPAPLNGPIRTAWKYVPSMQLGGDAFGYHWLDEENLAIYLLDVCGHGVGAALLSVSAMNVLRSRTLPGVDFHQPGQVLAGLNEAFPMESNNGMYFTIWYGVYNSKRREVTYASGGHPPAALLPPPSGGGETRLLRSGGLVIGCMPNIKFKTDSCPVAAGARLFVFSDGVYEVTLPNGTLWTMGQFLELLAAPVAPGVSELDRVVEAVQEVHGSQTFEDDFSLLQITLA
jgi:sigma-B regulation protein RsbU (phosphoserine phosphatase)